MATLATFAAKSDVVVDGVNAAAVGANLSLLALQGRLDHVVRDTINTSTDPNLGQLTRQSRRPLHGQLVELLAGVLLHNQRRVLLIGFRLFETDLLLEGAFLGL